MARTAILTWKQEGGGKGKPRFRNEFANWASQALQEEGLAERLTAIDLLAVTSTRDLRTPIITAVEKYLDDGRRLRECPSGDELHFCEAKSFVSPTGLVAHDASELFAMIGRSTDACLYFHFFEARLRLERPANDFSLWLKNHGEPRLAQAIDRLNPYDATLAVLRGPACLGWRPLPHVTRKFSRTCSRPLSPRRSRGFRSRSKAGQ